MIGSCNQPFSKTICSICYEDLKPIVEDLQAISICGHVFHELCIQQLFESNSKGKKKCPICKQTCSASNVSRLYFQSVGDSNEPNIVQKFETHKEDLDAHNLEVRRLEGRISGLKLVLDSRENDLIKITDELSVCKEQLEKEKLLKNEAIEQTRTINNSLLNLKTQLSVCEENLKIDALSKEQAMEQTHTISSLLNLKTHELSKVDMERIKLQEMNLSLVKEVAALKLVSDLELEEDEIVKLASLGTELINEDSVDILKKTLVVRNKLYKELLNKYNMLKKDHERSLKELEKSKRNLGKIEKSKKKIHKIEIAKEMNDNDVLSAPIASKNTKDSSDDTIKEPDTHHRKIKRSRVTENIEESNNKDGVRSYILIEDDAPAGLLSPESPLYESVPQATKSAITDDVACNNKTGQDKPHPNTPNKVCLPDINSQQGVCFTAGLQGPGGIKRHLGRWCKKGKN